MKFDATDENAYFPAYEYMKTLIEFSQIVQGLRKMQDATMFMHYFNRSGQVSDTTPMPKFILYSAHAETVAPILHAFDSALLETP